MNNGYGMGTPVAGGSALADLHGKACAYDMASAEVDGNDPLATRDAVREALDRARSRARADAADVHSFRLKGHSVVDPDRYRSRGLSASGSAAEDPLAAFARRADDAGVLDQAKLRSIDEEVGARDRGGGRSSPTPAPSPTPTRLFEFSYATRGAPTSRRRCPGEAPWR